MNPYHLPGIDAKKVAQRLMVKPFGPWVFRGRASSSRPPDSSTEVATSNRRLSVGRKMSFFVNFKVVDAGLPKALQKGRSETWTDFVYRKKNYIWPMKKLRLNALMLAGSGLSTYVCVRQGVSTHSGGVDLSTIIYVCIYLYIYTHMMSM